MPKSVDKSDKFEIRRLETADYEQAAEIFAFVHALHQKNRPDIYRKTDMPLCKDEFFKMCADRNGILLCVEENRRVLGIACAYMRENSGDAVSLPRIKAFMEDFAVRPDAQGCGVGSALLKAVEAEAKRRGADALELMVWSFNDTAIKFYENVGMTPRSVIMEKKI